jgi:hypothetical protein
MNADSWCARPLAAGGGEGRAETPFVVNGEVGRPAGTLQATGATRIGLDNPARTWVSAAWVYCLQKPGSAARAVVV